MTININSLWVLLGIAITLGFGGCLGVIYAVLLIRAARGAGVWIADRIIDVVTLFRRWRSGWKN
jgi:hypothetical protein